MKKRDRRDRRDRQTEALAANEARRTERNGTEELTGALTGCHKYSNE